MICGDCWIYADNPFCTPESHESVQKLIKSEQKGDFYHQNCCFLSLDMDNGTHGAAQSSSKTEKNGCLKIS